MWMQRWPCLPSLPMTHLRDLTSPPLELWAPWTESEYFPKSWMVSVFLALLPSSQPYRVPWCITQISLPELSWIQARSSSIPSPISHWMWLPPEGCDFEQGHSHQPRASQRETLSVTNVPCSWVVSALTVLTQPFPSSWPLPFLFPLPIILLS